MTFKLNRRTEQFFIRNAGLLHADKIGLNTFEELKDWAAKNGIENSMPVYTPSDDEVQKSPFRTVAGAMAFQAWHDRRHISFAKAFTLDGEHWLALQHVDELLRAGQHPIDVTAIYFMIYGRNAYFYNNGHHAVSNTSAFIDEAFAEGVEIAARRLINLEHAYESGNLSGFF